MKFVLVCTGPVPVQHSTWMCGADKRGCLVQRGQVEADRLVVVLWPVAAHNDGRVPLLDNLTVPLDHQSVLPTEHEDYMKYGVV